MDKGSAAVWKTVASSVSAQVPLREKPTNSEEIAHQQVASSVSAQVPLRADRGSRTDHRGHVASSVSAQVPLRGFQDFSWSCGGLSCILCFSASASESNSFLFLYAWNFSLHPLFQRKCLWEDTDKTLRIAPVQLHPLFQRKCLWNPAASMISLQTLELHPLFQCKCLWNIGNRKKGYVFIKLHPLFQCKCLWNLYNDKISVCENPVASSVSVQVPLRGALKDQLRVNRTKLHPLFQRKCLWNPG